MIYSLYVISKSGSLLYQRDFRVQGTPLVKQSSNDYLVIASTLHGVHAIASKLTPPDANNNWAKSPLGNSNRHGLQMINTERFKISVYQSVTGLKVIVVGSKDVAEARMWQLQDRIYALYNDYVLKNPFYQLEMPIRLRAFEDKVLSTVTTFNV